MVKILSEYNQPMNDFLANPVQPNIYRNRIENCATL